MSAFNLVARRLLFVTLLTPVAAFAALGGSVSDVANDQVQLNAARRVATPTGLFEVHELTQANGTLVREYVNPATKKVFAVTWSGPLRPDMRSVLGPYLERTQRTVAHADHRSIKVEDSDAVIQSSGRMGAGFNGRAWLPQDMPAGVQVTDIK